MVITIDTGYQNRPSFITGSRAHSVLWQARDPGGGDDLFFLFFFCLSAQHPQSDRVYPRSTILQQGMHLNVFSKVYYDRVYFSCAERNMTGSGFDPPPPSGTPLSSWEVECPPPPPRGSLAHRHIRGENNFPSRSTRIINDPYHCGRHLVPSVYSHRVRVHPGLSHPEDAFLNTGLPVATRKEHGAFQQRQRYGSFLVRVPRNGKLM